MLRCEEPGWQLCAMHDPAGRRGLWMRITEVARSELVPSVASVVEICAGREGDDAYVRFEAGQTVTERQLSELFDVLDYAKAALELWREAEGGA